MKKLIIGSAAVFVALMLCNYVVHEVILKLAYQATSHFWRPEGEMKMGILIFNNLIIAFLFTLIFSKGYEGKGIVEGMRYGLCVGLLMNVPMAYGTYAVMPIPYSLALQWFLYGVIVYVVLGVVVSLVFGKTAQPART